MDIVIDTSALVAVLQEEDTMNSILDAVQDKQVFISTATLQETFIVIHSRLGEEGWEIMEGILNDMSANLVVLDEQITQVAMDAYVNYGKGQGTKAGLNYGDCFAYATAKSLDVPLLFIGSDFSHTDIESVL